MHSKGKYVAALLVGAFVLAALSAPSQALTDCEKRQRWERKLAYIDTISLTCRVVTTAGVTAGSFYVPYSVLVPKVGSPVAQELFEYALARGINLKRDQLDKHRICRILRAVNALAHQPRQYKSVRRRLFQYGLCAPTSASCKARMQAEIFRVFGLTDACAKS
jgi:hypothetical protein